MMEILELSTRCAWCGQIKSGNGWQEEHRKRPVRYSHGICPTCRKFFFPKRSLAKKPRNLVSVQRWRETATGALKVATSFVLICAMRLLRHRFKG